MNKRKGFSVNIGFSSIMMVFLMICLVTFATLSVLTANADYRLSKKTADKTTAFYEADSIARQTIYNMDQILAEKYSTSSDAVSYYSGIDESLLRDGLPNEVQNLTVTLQNEVPVVAYEVQVSEVQSLYCTLQICYPQSQGESFLKIIQWQTKTSNAPEESDTLLHLFGN